MQQPTASGDEQCPLDTSHAAHYWRYKDEPENYFKRCRGLLIPHVDVYERRVNGAR